MKTAYSVAAETTAVVDVAAAAAAATERNVGHMVLTHQPRLLHCSEVPNEEVPEEPTDPTLLERLNALIDSHGLGAAANAPPPPHRAARDIMPSTAAIDETPGAAGKESSQPHFLLLALQQGVAALTCTLSWSQRGTQIWMSGPGGSTDSRGVAPDG